MIKKTALFLLTVLPVVANAQSDAEVETIKSGYSLYEIFGLIGLLAFVSIAVLSVVQIRTRLIEAADKNNELASSNFMQDAIDDFLVELKSSWKALLWFGVVLVLIFVGIEHVKGTSMESHVKEWLNLIVRWIHIVFGIAWIGASFYFVFLENSLNRTENIRDEIAGDLWAVHGGGFYFLEKYKVAPKEIPDRLHWFKYEAYFTWLSGFILLWIVYYADAHVYMVDPAVSDITPGAAIALGVGVLIGSWLVYDLLCKSKLVNQPIQFSLVMLLFVSVVAYGLCQVLSARAAYMHVGAMLGTWMVANVFMVIIPSQKAMVNAAKSGRPLNPQLGIRAGRRSLHNNYFTLPVIFVMMSNHFPSTFGHQFNWAILIGLFVISAGVKHYFNLAEQGKSNSWLVPAAAIGLIGLAMITAPKTNVSSCDEDEIVTIAQVQEIINNRCISCHSINPTDPEQAFAPNGMMFDTPEQILLNVQRIKVRAVLTNTMPQGNKTNMTEEERNLLGCWIDQGAVIE